MRDIDSVITSAEKEENPAHTQCTGFFYAPATKKHQ
jgi:hypothetical protein